MNNNISQLNLSPLIIPGGGFNIADWYWFIGTDTNNVWSSKKAISVPIADTDYQDWLTAGNAAAPIEMVDLEQMFSEQYPAGMLKTYTLFKRWQKEQGGLTMTTGMPIKTDDRAQAKINGVRGAAIDDPSFTTQWAAADESIWPLDAAGIATMSRELQAHIDNCFAISADTLSGITGGTITTIAQIDAAFA